MNGRPVPSSLFLRFAGGAHHRVSPSRTPGTVLVAGGGTGGDGVPATQARLVEPFAVARDSRGNLYIAETGANRVRRMDPTGLLTTVAGRGGRGNAGDGGPGAEAQLGYPHHLACPPDGRLLYLADS